MVVCKYFLQGTCKFGQSCKYEHQINDTTQSHSTSILRQQTNSNIDTNTLVRAVQNDMLSAEKGGQWLLSSYAPFKDKPAFPGFEDKSFEEVRLGYYEATTSGTVEQYKQQLQMALQDSATKIKALQNPTPEAVNMLTQIYNTPVGSTNFGSSQASVFGHANQQQPSVFGQAQNATQVNQQSSVFGQSQNVSQVNQQQPSVFGQTQNASHANQQPSVFGQAQNPSQSIFATSNQSIFNKSPQNSLFTGNQTSPSTIFGGAQQTSNPSVFGGTQQPSSQNIFGRQSNVFSGPEQRFGNQSSSMFGGQQSATPFSTSNNSPFGAQSNSNSLFAPKNTSTFSQQPTNNSVFGAQATTNSPFGLQTAQNSPFGTQNTSLFASQQTKSIFGQQNTTASPFQNATPSPFGTQQTSPFGGQQQHTFSTEQIAQPSVPVFAIQQNQSNSPLNNQQQLAPVTFGNQQPNSVFSTLQGQVANNQSQTSTNTNIFGNSDAMNTNSAFSNTSIFGSNSATSVTNLNTPREESAYSKLEELSENDIKCYESDTFEFGNIPEKPPTMEMCV